MFEPEKISVLREHLPIGVNYNDDWVEEMLSYMDSLGINCINNKSILIEKSKTENVFNVQYDAGHWNDLGCFYSTNNLLQKIHIDFPQVTELQMGDFTISTKTEKYLPVSEFIVNEQVPSFSLNSGWNDFTTDYAAEIEINNNYSHFHYYENTMENAAILPKTMIFQGSYYNSRPQFLVSRTHEDIGIHNYQNVFNLDYYFNIFEPDIVIFEVTEYTFSDVYFDSLKMNQIDWNPSLIDPSSELSVNEQLQSVILNTQQVELDSILSIVRGKKIDYVYCDRAFPLFRYCYFIANDRVYDLKKNDGGILTASLSHGVIKNNDIVYLVLEDEKGNKFSTVLKVTESELIQDQPALSANARFDNHIHSYTLSSGEQNNVFNAVNLQLINTESGKFIETIHSTDHKDKIIAVYTHTKRSGLYTLRLKANGTLQDEYIDINTYLVKGASYQYEYCIEDLTEHKVLLSNYKVYGPRLAIDSELTKN